MNNDTCWDCGVAIGEVHLYGCDIERCPDCGAQALFHFRLLTCPSCKKEHIFVDCTMKSLEHPRIPFDGEWPGVREAREYGFYAKLTNRGWTPCDKADPEASEDLNRVIVECRWDADQARYVRKQDENS